MAVKQFEKVFALSGSYVEGKILVYEDSYSVANNTSSISVYVQVHRTNSGYSTYGSGTVTGYVNGTYYSQSVSSSQKVTGTSWVTFVAKNYTISHNSDGSKSFEVTANISWQRTGSASLSCTLTTIPRASSISWGSGTSSEAGITNGTNINISRASSSFTHTITYQFGNASGTVCTKTTATNVKWTIPLSLLNQIPNATSGTGTMRCTTYSGNTAIGTSTLSLYVYAPDSVKPTVSSASVAIDNSANSVIAGWGLYVVGYSKAKITASASGSYSSSISSFTISGGYSTTQSGSSLSYTGSKFTSSGSKTFNVTAKDSRGRSSDSKSAGTITVYAYSNPTISAFSVQRSSSDAKKVIVKANWTYSSVNSKNSTTAILKYKQSDSSGWTTYGAISKNTNVTLTTEFAEEYSYKFQLIVTDTVGNSAQIESFISTIDVLLDFKAGGKGLGVGKIAETDSMEVALDAKFMGAVYIYDTDGTEMTLEAYIKKVAGIT